MPGRQSRCKGRRKFGPGKAYISDEVMRELHFHRIKAKPVFIIRKKRPPLTISDFPSASDIYFLTSGFGGGVQVTGAWSESLFLKLKLTWSGDKRTSHDIERKHLSRSRI